MVLSATDRETAVEFDKRIEAAFKLMGDVNTFLQTRLSDADPRTFGDAWAEIVTELDLGVPEVIYRAHPDLRPDGMVLVTPLGKGCEDQTPDFDPWPKR